MRWRARWRGVLVGLLAWLAVAAGLLVSSGFDQGVALALGGAGIFVLLLAGVIGLHD